MIKLDESFEANQLQDQKLKNTSVFKHHYSLEPIEESVQLLFQETFNVYKDQYFGPPAYCTVTVNQIEKDHHFSPKFNENNDDELIIPTAFDEELSVLILIKNIEFEKLSWDSAHHCIIKRKDNQDSEHPDNSVFNYNLVSYVSVSGTIESLPSIEFNSHKRNDFTGNAKCISDHIINLGKAVEEVEGTFRQSMFEIFWARINTQNNFLIPNDSDMSNKNDLDLRHNIMNQMLRITGRNSTFTEQLNETLTVEDSTENSTVSGNDEK